VESTEFVRVGVTTIKTIETMEQSKDAILYLSKFAQVFFFFPYHLTSDGYLVGKKSFATQPTARLWGRN